MSIRKMINIVKQQTMLATANLAAPAIGIVTSFDPDNFTVQVQLHPATEDDPAIITGNIPLLSPWIGDGWGMFCPPNLNDLVVVLYQQNNYQSALGAMRIFNNTARPLPVPSGEFWLVHASGTYFKMTNDGKLLLNGDVEIDVTSPEIKITASTEITVNSPSVKLGNGSLKKLVTDALISAYNSHVHTDPQGGTTGTPTVSLTSAVTTTNTEAS